MEAVAFRHDDAPSIDELKGVSTHVWLDFLLRCSHWHSRQRHRDIHLEHTKVRSDILYSAGHVGDQGCCCIFCSFTFQVLCFLPDSKLVEAIAH